MGESELVQETRDQASLVFGQDRIERYLQKKLDQGVSNVSAAKYRTPLYELLRWTGDDPTLTASRLCAWRKTLEAHDYSKDTIQRKVTVINDFLRAEGCEKLCIPRPLQNDLVGRTFGYLTVLEQTSKRRRKNVIWRCSCKCGKEVEVSTVMLLSGRTTSCGCLSAEILQYVNRYVEGTSLRQCMDDRVINPHSQSGFVGVQPMRDKWMASINYKGVRYNLGTYGKLEDAVKARAKGKERVMEDAARLYEEYADQYEEMPRRPAAPIKPPQDAPTPSETMARRSDNTSGQTGVNWQKGKWSASICVKGCRYRLGVYDHLEDAIAVRTKAETLVKAKDLSALEAMCTNGKKPRPQLI